MNELQSLLNQVTENASETDMTLTKRISYRDSKKTTK